MMLVNTAMTMVVGFAMGPLSLDSFGLSTIAIQLDAWRQVSPHGSPVSTFEGKPKQATKRHKNAWQDVASLNPRSTGCDLVTGRIFESSTCPKNLKILNAVRNIVPNSAVSSQLSWNISRLAATSNTVPSEHPAFGAPNMIRTRVALLQWS